MVKNGSAILKDHSAQIEIRLCHGSQLRPHPNRHPVSNQPEKKDIYRAIIVVCTAVY